MSVEVGGSLFDLVEWRERDYGRAISGGESNRSHMFTRTKSLGGVI
jgi:hypothetical protein